MEEAASSRDWSAPLKLHDADSWRLPDWEEYSESGGSAWTDDPRDSDADSDASAAALRVPRSPPMASRPSLTTSTARLLPLQVKDLRALHLRFAKERQEAVVAASEPNEQTTAITTQLESVREQLREFQQQWQAQTEKAPHLQQQQQEQPQETAMAVRFASGTLRFDMAVQTDVAFNDDALRQWLHLITQKMEVLTTSFHGDTTQLPLKYPLQTHLGLPVRFSQSLASGDESESVANWHVGGNLKTLVSESTAERLLDLERAVACLATATRQTTTRYVEYFEKIVVQIQELHQHRLRQVVDESLEEMKSQRSKYKRRVEQLEVECGAAREELTSPQQNTAAADQLDDVDQGKRDVNVNARQAEWERERHALLAEMARLEGEVSTAHAAQVASETRAEQARQQLEHMTSLLEAAQRNAQEVAAISVQKDEILHQVEAHASGENQRREEMVTRLRAELLKAERAVQTNKAEAERRLRDVEDAANKSHVEELNQLHRKYQAEIDDLMKAWHEKMEQAQETKRLAPAAVCVDQQVQTSDALADSSATTDERIARLKKRCKALESLLDKKFEDSSAASIASMDSAVSGRWSPRSETRHAQESWEDMRSRTLPLTLSLESSLDDTYASSFPVHAPSRDLLKQSVREAWDSRVSHGESSSNRSLRSDHGSISAAAAIPASGSDAPSTESMLALVRKLETLASSTHSGLQPDEEPALSDISTPKRKPSLASRPSSASLMRKPGWAAKSGARSPGSYIAPMHSLKDPRQQRQCGNHGDSKVSAAGGQSAKLPTARQHRSAFK